MQVYKVDVERNLLFIRGHVPGSKGGIIRVSDALTQPFPSPPPFPTISLEDLEGLGELVRPVPERNPWLAM